MAAADGGWTVVGAPRPGRGSGSGRGPGAPRPALPRAPVAAGHAPEAWAGSSAADEADGASDADARDGDRGKRRRGGRGGRGGSSAAERAALLRERVDAALLEVEGSAFFAGLLDALRGACIMPARDAGRVSEGAATPAGAAGAADAAETGGPARMQGAWRWGPAEGLVAYGLGPLSASASARSQLALALLLARELGGWVADGAAAAAAPVADCCAGHGASPGPAADGPEPPCWRLRAYDPAFGPLDEAELRWRGCDVMTSDELDLDESAPDEPPAAGPGPASEATAAARAAAAGGGGPSRRTLFFMPHCEAGLYDRLLRRRWAAADGLATTAVLGNSFALYADRWALAGGRSVGLLGAPRPPVTAAAAAESRGAAASAAPPVDGRPRALLAAAALAAEAGVPEAGFPVLSAFNDLSLHIFPPARRPPGATGGQPPWAAG